MNIKQVIQEIKTKAESHAQIKQFSLLTEQKISNEFAFQYPLLICYPSTFTITDDAEVMYFDLICLDRQMTDQSNMIDVYNDTAAILKDMLSMLIKDSELGYGFSGNAQRIQDDAVDFVGGWLVSLQVEMAYEEDVCAIPTVPS